MENYVELDQEEEQTNFIDSLPNSLHQYIKHPQVQIFI